MSGIDIVAKYEYLLERLEQTLDRRVSVDAISSLRRSVSDRSESQPEFSKTAIGFDSSVFLRLAKQHPRNADILDYLPQHSRPLILPGQSIQEFWNNHLNVIDPLGKKLRSQFERFSEEARKVDHRFGRFEAQITGAISDMEVMLGELEAEYGNIYDGDTKARVESVIETMERLAYCAFVPRIRFSEICRLRNQTRTPPGFRDSGDGDFFIWADFLFGLLISEEAEDYQEFERIAFVTVDKKIDWSARGIPHPILSAEVKALFGCPFVIWDLEFFAKEVGKAI